MIDGPADFLAERQALHRDVFPEIRDFCESLGYEFEIIDIGVEKGTVPDVAFQLRQLAAARSEPLGPFYLVGGGYQTYYLIQCTSMC